MSYINLIDQISELDKKRIENYISLFSVSKKEFIGIDEWLQNWSHSNQKLYKLLGNKLVHKFDYRYDKRPADMEREMNNLLATHPFRTAYRQFYFNVIKGDLGEVRFDLDQRGFFNHLTDTGNFVDDAIWDGIKLKEDGKKMLQIPKGTKPMKALQKVMKYFDEFPWDYESFEDFRLKHSMILNDKTIKGKLCVSIHPLDFMTMSDNGSKWSSCMSWIEDGCYHAGTIEMLNSNNVLCCYLAKEDNEWDFSEKGNPDLIQHEMDDDYTWNNKKWRQLVYATKDIIMTGKSYPYYNEDVSKDLLNKVQELAKENIGWTYTYGIERYKDMIHINSNVRMMKNRDWVYYGGKKHNIIWDTKGMYNDMFNDNYYEYWCVRNKVDHNKMISVSGKCNCLRCNGKILTYEGNSYYNERFGHTSATLCCDCAKDLECDICNDNSALYDIYNIASSDKHRSVDKICAKCFKKYAKKCPCCGKPIWVENNDAGYSINGLYVIYDGLVAKGKKSFCAYNGYIGYFKNDIEVESCYVCEDCGPKLIEQGIVARTTVAKKQSFWTDELTDKYAYVFLNPEDAEKFLYKNLEACEYKEFMKLNERYRVSWDMLEPKYECATIVEKDKDGVVRYVYADAYEDTIDEPNHNILAYVNINENEPRGLWTGFRVSDLFNF